MAFKDVWNANDLTRAYRRNEEGATGKIRIEPDGKIYRWISNGCGETIYPGYVVYHGTNDLTLGEVYKMNQSSKGTNLGLGAGVALATISPNSVSNALSYGWIQIHGPNDQVLMLSTSTALALGSNTIGVNDQFYVTHGTASGTAPLYSTGVQALEALATTVTVATVKKGFIRFYR